ncbi:hypothetical protein INT45_012670 [Circinella minor]|uniref:Uncharacterized protein n=1 Tax=Circinella minor TaxID=1195481 RepID=A0A8H7S2D0_9FUNG|nr:hypothetical protein INT45_012670 [Circinella minor]
MNNINKRNRSMSPIHSSASQSPHAQKRLRDTNNNISLTAEEMSSSLTQMEEGIPTGNVSELESTTLSTTSKEEACSNKKDNENKEDTVVRKARQKKRGPYQKNDAKKVRQAFMDLAYGKSKKQAAKDNVVTIYKEKFGDDDIGKENLK